MSTPKTNLHEIEIAFTQMNDAYGRGILSVILPQPTSPVAVAASEALESHARAKDALLERSMASTDAAIASLESAIVEIDTLRAQAEQQREVSAAAHARAIKQLDLLQADLQHTRSTAYGLQAQRDSLFELLEKYVPASVIREWRSDMDDPCDKCDGRGCALEEDDGGQYGGARCVTCSGIGIYQRRIG